MLIKANNYNEDIGMPETKYYSGNIFDLLGYKVSVRPGGYMQYYITATYFNGS